MDLTFEHMQDAERFCSQRGWSLGRLQRGSPRGIICSPDFDIQKWRNLRQADRKGLDGLMLTAGYGGPWTILIGPEHVQNHLKDR